ncbi:cyclopropane-fatty-acyl-phospholipid synthase family protein [Sphingobium sufflavum]|nr:cyclopropane-fatty-acyl-phospholipid synthase family protein [Sphingobium sufflavum]MCE7797409.1 cyclopropane-fatty-acyl-phospholipid synthase family protein [Sphingobium sufflavum]
MARLPVRLFHELLDRIDAGLATGSLEGHLPDGCVRLLGGRAEGPACVVHLHSWRALARLALSGSVGWYRAWVKGEWSSPDPVPLFALFMANARTLGGTARARGLPRLAIRLWHGLNRNSRKGARRNIAYHYDLGNAFYALWLDRSMTYSSALYARPGIALEDAQAAKIDAMLDRLDLSAGQRLLEVGCGWGSLALRAAERCPELRYDGLTLSTEQKGWADARLAEADVADRAAIHLADYRDFDHGPYDAIASVEMVEAIGQAQWPEYLATLHGLLAPGGRAAIQFISIDDAIFDSYAGSADFIQTYIFPGGCLIARDRFRALAEAAGFEWRDERSMGQDYARTLLEWRERFDAAIMAGKLPHAFDEPFVKLWRFYLIYCEGGFRGGGIDTHQVTLVRR